MDNFILILDIIGAVAFAYSGVVVAIRHKMDLLGVVLLGCITACGGGFFRDIVLGKFPENLFNTPNYELIAAFSTSLLLFIVFYFIPDLSFFEKHWFKTSVTIADAIGLGVFVIMGANVALEESTNWFMVTFLATLTAIGGGMFRDLLSMRIPVIFSKHIYCVAAIMSSLLYYIMYLKGANLYLATILTVIFTVLIRTLAYKFEINLPQVNLSNKKHDKKVSEEEYIN